MGFPHYGSAGFLPMLLLTLGEAALRLSRYGHPTSFFVPKRVNGTNVLVENAWFGLSFFPPALARSPAPLCIRPKKAPGAYRIFLFGESAALGDPRPAYGVGRFLETLLVERYPGIEFEVIPVAMTAINSHAVLPMARECARYDDLWLVYMGNNEFAGPFGADTVFGPRALGFRLSALTSRSSVCASDNSVGCAAQAANRGSREPVAWGGLKMFLDNQLAPLTPVKRASMRISKRTLMRSFARDNMRE